VKLTFLDGTVLTFPSTRWGRLRPEDEERVALHILGDNPAVDFAEVRGRVVRRPEEEWLSWLEAR
jgi:hypothetical protein